MTELLSLRPYQRACLDAVQREYDAGRQRVAVVLATGLGKTVIFSHLTAEYLNGPGSERGDNVLILVHRDELVNQAVDKLMSVVGGDHSIGVVKAGRNEVDARVIVGSVQTLRNPLRLDQLPNIGLVIVDECHHAAATSYRYVLDALGCFDEAGNPLRVKGTKALGVTATLSRNDGKALGDVWETVAYQRDILDGIADGYLCDVIGRMVSVEGLDLSDAPTTAGDFQAGTLGDLMSTPDAQKHVTDAYDQYASDMPGIIFVPSVAAAFEFTQAFDDAGYSVATVWGAMDPDVRREVLTDYQNGLIQILVNCSVLTEGFDAPRAQCAVIARPTMSAALYVQMVGRVLRPFPGKDRALVLDVVGASEDHRLATIADLSTRRIQEVRDGESIREAVIREIKDRSPALRNYVVNTEEVDLFHRSRATWLQTRAGLWFLQVMNAAVFIWPMPNGQSGYRVGIRPLRISGGRWAHSGPVTLDAAMAWGEKAADEYAAAYQGAYPDETRAFNRNRRASWRRQNATAAQRTNAYRFGVELDESVSYRRGELSDLISVAIVSPLIDKI